MIARKPRIVARLKTVLDDAHVISDAAETRARTAGFDVLQGATDKPHGLRETYIQDPDGYVWVASVEKAD